MSKKVTHIIGTFLISGKGAFLNSPGKENDVTVPKTFYTLDERGKQVRVPYVSAQSWKRWLRNTYHEENTNDNKSQIKILRINDKGDADKIGPDMNPILFLEDDVFGYMRTLADKDVKNKKDSDQVDEEDEKQSFQVKPLIRASPFQASILSSIRKTPNRTIDDGWVHPEGASKEIIDANQTYRINSLGYKTEFYDTNLQGIFGLAYHRLGVFRNDGDRVELDVKLEKKYLEEGQIKIVDNKERIYELVNNDRKERTSKILRALVNMRGGAKQTAFATPVHPQLIILSGLSCGNLIFNNLFKDTVDGPVLNIEALKEILSDYKDRLATNVYIGVRTGYLTPENEKHLKSISNHSSQQNMALEKEDETKKIETWGEGITVIITTPIQAVSQFINELPEKGLEIKVEKNEAD